MTSIQKYLLMLSVVVILASGCANEKQTAEPAAKPQLTPLQLREYQTGQFDTNDVALIMKVLVDVLRDDGFAVNSLNTEPGTVNASRTVHFKKRQEARAALSDLGLTVKHEKNFALDLTATASEFGGGCRMRLRSQVRVLRSSGTTKNTLAVESPQYYRTFFEKIQKGLFLENQKL